MQIPQVVVFDLGKVLLDFDYSILARNFVGHSELSDKEILELLNQSPLLFRYESGEMTTNEFFAEVKKLARMTCGLDEFEAIFGDIFQEIPEMVELNRQLRARQVPTFIFSNTNEMAIKHIRRNYPFFSEFTDFVLSYEHGAMKPKPRIYEVVERITKTARGGILYIDDRLENIEEGRRRGWQTIHHADPKETIPIIKRHGLLG